MRFHEQSDYNDILHQRLTTELSWENYTNNSKDFTPKSKEEVLKLLDQLQVYISFDFPYEKRGLNKNDKNIREIMFAFDNVCRIACMMAEDTDEDKLHIDYFNEKFSNVLHFLALKK